MKLLIGSFFTAAPPRSLLYLAIAIALSLYILISTGRVLLVDGDGDGDHTSAFMHLMINAFTDCNVTSFWIYFLLLLL
jgi:hypothetical protein